MNILQGYVNHVFWQGVVPLLGREKALIWPKNLKVMPKNYHGEIFEANACQKLLQEADKLNDVHIYKSIGQLQLVPFISAFKAMNLLVNSCFGTNNVDMEILPDLIEHVKKMHIGTGVSKTLKVHVILDHIEQCLKLLSGSGLGIMSEQAGEAIHREFLKFWDKYKINMIEDSSYIDGLQKAVVEFSRHI